MFTIGSLANSYAKSGSLAACLPCYKGSKERVCEMISLIERLDEQMKKQGKPESFTFGYKFPSSREEWDRWCNDEAVRPLVISIEQQGERTEFEALSETEMTDKLIGAGWL
jgi:hypothetical protein